jgi:hypothetical protein
MPTTTTKEARTNLDLISPRFPDEPAACIPTLRPKPRNRNRQDR